MAHEGQHLEYVFACALGAAYACLLSQYTVGVGNSIFACRAARPADACTLIHPGLTYLYLPAPEDPTLVLAYSTFAETYVARDFVLRSQPIAVPPAIATVRRSRFHTRLRHHATPPAFTPIPLHIICTLTAHSLVSRVCVCVPTSFRIAA